MKKTLRYILVVLLTMVGGRAMAQDLNSAYFLDGYAYGHELNPAKNYDRKGYFSFPGLLGNLNLGVKGNLAMKDLLYKNPNGDGLVTYLHPDISSSEAMSGFSKNNKLLTDLRFDIFSLGFHAGKAYHTVTLGLRANMGVNVPYELFDLTKNLANKDYDLGTIGATATVWAEAGYGYSRKVNDQWRVGGKFKLLVGGGNVRVKADNLKLDFSGENEWVAVANASVDASVKGITWGEPKVTTNNAGETYEEVDFDNIDVNNPGIGGAGAAIDLGVEWEMKDLLPGMKLGASLLDLGFIHWNNTITAANNGKPFVFRGFHDVKVVDGPGVPIEDQYDNLADDLEDLYRLEAVGGNNGRTQMLGATLNVSAEYALPMYKKLKFGFLSTTRIQGQYSWNEERLGFTLSPCKAFELAANVGVGTLGSSWGWVINVHPRGFNLFVGMDHMLGKLSKQGIPLKSNADFSMGLNFPIGKNKKI